MGDLIPFRRRTEVAKREHPNSGALERIRMRLERINRLLADLKRYAAAYELMDKK